MKTILAAILTLTVFLVFHTPKTKKRKRITLAMYAFTVIILSVMYNLRTIDYILPFYQPVSQTIYQISFLKDGGYTDAFLDEFLNGKTVHTPDDARNITDENPKSPRLSTYYHAYSMWNYLESNNASIIKDPTLNGYTLDSAQKLQFQDLGLANDLMRYTFPYTKYANKYGNGFFHYWYYSMYSEESHIFLCVNNLNDSKELIMLWEKKEDGMTEDYYIISKEQFKSLFSLPQQQQGDV